jgi:hypothetical protein
MIKIRMKKISAIILIICVLFISEDLYSQKTGNINATAMVLTRISVTNKRDLDFGANIVPGIQQTVDKTAASSGKFSVSGQPSKQISILLTLPAQLLNGSNSMPITFTSTDAGYQLPGGSIVAFNPAATATIAFGADGTMDIFLGGKVTPSTNQVSGVYMGLVTVNLQYSGL